MNVKWMVDEMKNDWIRYANHQGQCDMMYAAGLDRQTELGEICMPSIYSCFSWLTVLLSY